MSPSDTDATTTIPLKDEHGRRFNSTNELYILPADAPEFSRLDIQHQMLKLKMGGIYWPVDLVRRILTPRPEGVQGPVIADIGSGSGAWAVEMAREFPHAEVIGFDIVPAKLTGITPANCRFECKNVNEGLAGYENRFDVVHIRCTFHGIIDGPEFLKEVYSLVRPGGLLLMVDICGIRDQTGAVITQDDPKAPGFSWMARLQRVQEGIIADRAAVHNKGDAAGYMIMFNDHRWLPAMSEWEAQDHRSFLIPIGPCPADADGDERQAAELLRQNCLRIIASWRPVFLGLNRYSEEEVDEWLRRTKEEVEGMTARTFLGVQASWALKSVE